MKIEIVGKNIEITDGIKEAINTNLSELDKYFKDKELEAKVIVKTYSIGQKVEINLKIDASHIIRQEVMHDDLYAAIDISRKKLEEQIKRFKDRLITQRHSNKEEVMAFFLEHENSGSESKQITKRKELENKPMSEEEAILQFEISGHDFFIFEDANTEITKLLYKRKDKEYGILEIN